MHKIERILFLSSEAHEPGKAGLKKFPPAMPDNLDSLVHPGLD
jgi:hypothetical protein